MPTWIFYALGYLVACFAAHPLVKLAVKGLWSVAEDHLKEKNALKSDASPLHNHPTVSFWHGVAERAVYTTSIVLGKPEGIAVWLAFKAVVRWKPSEEPDPRHVPGSAIYMIGTALNVGFGIAGGLIALRRWSF
jgi:hypothetical protein